MKFYLVEGNEQFSFLILAPSPTSSFGKLNELRTLRAINLYYDWERVTLLLVSVYISQEMYRGIKSLSVSFFLGFIFILGA